MVHVRVAEHKGPVGEKYCAQPGNVARQLVACFAAVLSSQWLSAQWCARRTAVRSGPKRPAGTRQVAQAANPAWRNSTSSQELIVVRSIFGTSLSAWLARAAILKHE
jgi:hypothetical protein